MRILRAVLLLSLACLLTGTFLAHKRKAFQSGGGAPASFGDDFSTNPSSRWNNVAGSALSWNSGPANVTVPITSLNVFTDTQFATTDQWAYCTISFDAGGLQHDEFTGLVLRSNNDTGDAYAFRNDDGDMRLRSINGASGVNDIYTWARTLTDDDYIGFTVTGTGNSTEFVLYDFGVTPPSGGPDETSWATAADSSVTVNSGNWIDNTEPANTGTYAAMYNGTATASTTDHDDFNAGDWTP